MRIQSKKYFYYSIYVIHKAPGPNAARQALCRGPHQIPLWQLIIVNLSGTNWLPMPTQTSSASCVLSSHGVIRLAGSARFPFLRYVAYVFDLCAAYLTYGDTSEPYYGCLPPVVPLF